VGQILQVEVFWVVTSSCSVLVGYQCFRGLCRLHFGGSQGRSGRGGEDGSSMDLWNVGTLPRHYTTSQPWRPRLETSPSWKPQNSHAVNLSVSLHPVSLKLLNRFP